MLIGCGRPHFFKKVGSNKSVHFSIAWDIVPFDLLHEDIFTSDVIRGLIFTLESCNLTREESEDGGIIPDFSYIRSCLINFLIKAPHELPPSILFPTYLLIREQLQYKMLAIKHNIVDSVESVELFYSGGSSYHCDKCGMDLCNAYFSAKQNDPEETTFCSQCIERAIADRGFLMNNKRVFKGLFNIPKQHTKLNPQSSLVLLYRYMDIDDLLKRCGFDIPTTHLSNRNSVYESLHQSLSDEENFPTESVSMQYCRMASGKNIIHNKGLVAIRDIPGRTYIAELKGNLRHIEDSDILHQFCIIVSKDTFIDTSRHDSPIRYVNHSCKPNAAFIEKWKGSKTKHVFLASLDIAILAGSEITVDYGSFRNRLFVECLCHDCKPSNEVTEP